MDIAKIAPTTYPLKIKDPATGKFAGLTIELADTSDPSFKAVQRSITDKGLTKARRGKIIAADEREENAINLMVSVVRGIKWENDADGKPASFGGKQLEFTEPNVRLLLAVDWLRDQVEDGLSEQSNFFKR